MQQSIISLIRCPVCGASGTVSEDKRSFYCEGTRRHCFDFSKSGYLNLAGPGGGVGDLKAAVRARSLFLDSGYYEPLSNEVNAILSQYNAASVLDAGCGEGYYSNRMAENGRIALGADLSVAGIDHAAKSAKSMGQNAGFLVASLFRLPVAEGSLDAVTNIFAPCAEDEFCRVLKPGGYLILVGAGTEHLFGLKRILYDDPYKNEGRSDLPEHMQFIERRNLSYEITVEGTERIQALFSMTPYYWRTAEHDREKLTNLTTLTTEIDFDIFIYRKG